MIDKLSMAFFFFGCLFPVFSLPQSQIKFVEYPGFEEAHSTWGSIGYSVKTNKVIVGVTNHKDRIALYEYDCKAKKMSLRNWVGSGGHLLAWQWQGKIHSQIVENKKDGWMYYGTDGGEEREESYMDHADGYSGGYFMKYNPVTFEVLPLGNGRRYESIKEVGIDQVRNRIYGMSYTASHFLIKDLNTDSLYDKGSLNKSHVTRTIFTDDWGNAYTSSTLGHLIKYEAAADSFIFSDDPLPYDPRTPGHMVRTGLHAWARDKGTNTFYFITYWARIFRFTPQEKGIGKIDDLGYIYDDPAIPIDTLINSYTPNLACGLNHKLYYLTGGHSKYLYKDKTVLIELDPKTAQKKILNTFPLNEIVECTGSDIVDKNGNIYFAARREAKDRDMGESGSSRPFLLIINPDKDVK